MRILLLATVCTLTSCIGGGLKRRFPTPPSIPLKNSKLKDYAGCYHIHTHFSHDSRGKFPDILNAAQKSGCDFLILTDHNTLQGKRYQGLHKNILVLSGAELSTPSGHLGALQIQTIPNRHQNIQHLLQQIRKQGGFSIVHHPHGGRTWKGGIHGFDAMEVFNLASLLKDNLVSTIFSALFVYPFSRKEAFASLIKRPSANLALFDKIAQQRHIVMIAANDAHAIPVGKLTLQIYEHLFPLVRIHILAKNQANILSALRKGRCYFAFDIFEDATSFLFYAKKKNSTQYLLMGDSSPFSNQWILLARSPVFCKFKLYKNGKNIRIHLGKTLSYSPQTSGVFRLEAYLPYPSSSNTQRWIPWVFTNPIWLKN
ncbi:MAG: PHP domain-containing protein [Planctomycetota bacterium]|nr:MAG: PHP domain-containing protein [Planctomycetota bacterium]